MVIDVDFRIFLGSKLGVRDGVRERKVAIIVIQTFARRIV